MRGWGNGCLSCSEQGGRSSGLLCGGCIVVRGVSEELYPTAYQRLQEMPPKDPLSFTQPRTSTACFIFKAYPVTKDTSVPRLDYMWTSVSSCMEGVWGGEGNVWGRAAPPLQASLCPTCFLMASGGRQIALVSLLPGYRGGVDAKHRSTTFTSWTIFLKVRI